MSLVQRWVAECDEPECDELYILEPISDGTKAEYGEDLNDAGWASAPNRRQTYCTQHLPDWWTEA